MEAVRAQPQERRVLWDQDLHTSELIRHGSAHTASFCHGDGGSSIGLNELVVGIVVIGAFQCAEAGENSGSQDLYLCPLRIYSAERGPWLRE